MILSTGPLALPVGLVTSRDAARSLRRDLEWILSPTDPGVSKLRACGQGVGAHNTRRAYGVDGRPMGGRKLCTSAHGCPVHSPMFSRDHIRAAEWFTAQHTAAGYQIVSYLLRPTTRWASAADSFGVVQDTVREITRARSGGGHSRPGPNGVTTYTPHRAPYAKTFRRFGLVGWITFLHMPFSPATGWAGHGHMYAFVRDLPDGVDGFEATIRAAAQAEVDTRVRSEMLDGFYTGDEDEHGRRAMVVNAPDEDGYPLWRYYSIHDPDHPDNPGSRFYEAKQDLAADRADDHFDYPPERRPGLDGGTGFLLWDRPPVGHDPELWDPTDRRWWAAVNQWHTTAAGSQVPPKPFDLIRDLGGLYLAGSITAGLLYREAAIATARGKRCLISRGLYTAYPPPAEVTDWTRGANLDTGVAVMITNAVCTAVDHAQRGRPGQDAMRIVEGLIGDGDLELALAVIRDYAGPNVELVEDRDGTPLIQYRQRRHA